MDEIKRIIRLYDNKKNIPTFKFKSKEDFITWYVDTKSKQNNCCFYCKTNQSIISSNIMTLTKRPRGRHLEVERKDSKNNTYDENNCVLACYFCNNAKSDVFNEDEFGPIATVIGQTLLKKLIIK